MMTGAWQGRFGMRNSVRGIVCAQGADCRRQTRASRYRRTLRNAVVAGGRLKRRRDGGVPSQCGPLGERALLWEQLSIGWSQSDHRITALLSPCVVWLRQFIVLSHVCPRRPSSASWKPVMSPSYSHSAAFAALASCNPYSEVQPTKRTRSAEPARTHPGRDIFCFP